MRFWLSPSNVADRATVVKQAFATETEDEKEGLPVIVIRHDPNRHRKRDWFGFDFILRVYLTTNK